MLEKHGSVAKVAYFEEKPVGQILFYPEESNVANGSPRKGVLVTLCVYNPASSAQKHGIGTKLLQSLILDAKRKKNMLRQQTVQIHSCESFRFG